MSYDDDYQRWENAGRDPTPEKIRDALAALEAALDDDGEFRHEPLRPEPRRRTWWRRRP